MGHIYIEIKIIASNLVTIGLLNFDNSVTLCNEISCGNGAGEENYLHPIWCRAKYKNLKMQIST
jgi:hypothetical protein